MPLTTTATNAALDAAVPNGYGGAHTAYPGDAGSSEVTGGSPAYARLAASWDAAATKAKALTAAVTGFNIPAGTIVKWWAAWSTVTAGTCKAAAPVGSSLRGVADVAASDTFTSRAHGLPNARRVVFYPVENSSLPTGLTEGADYFVINSATDTFQVSATEGGAAVDVGAGSVRWQDMVPATDSAQFVLDCTAFAVYG